MLRAPLDAANAQPVDAPKQCQKGGQRARTKPPGLEPGGGHAEGQSCAFLVPDAVVVAREHAKAVISRTKIGVERLTPCSWILPFRIATLQLVAKAHFLRSYEAQRRIVNFEITSQGRKTKAISRRRGFVVGNNLFDVYWRWYRIAVQVSWVDHLDDVLICEPQSSVRRLGCVRPERSRHRLGTVKHVKESCRHRRIGRFPPSLQLRIRDRNKSACRVKPKGSFSVRDEGVNHVAGKAIPHRQTLHSPVLPSDKPRRRRCQHRSVGIHEKAVDW